MEEGDPAAKRGAIHAIAYMGKFTDLRQNLKDALLSIHADGDHVIASDLADAFCPYGVPLTSLTREEAAEVASEFSQVRDWDFDQGAIPRFLSRFVSLFPDETYALLLRRVDQAKLAKENEQQWFRIFRLVHQNVSFVGVPDDKRIELGKDSIVRLVKSDAPDDLAELFWNVASFENRALQLILDIAPKADERGVRNISILIEKAIPRLAFVNPAFAKKLLANFSGRQREQIVEALAWQARRLGRGAFAGDPDEFEASQKKQFANQVAAFPVDAGLEDLARALRKLT